MLQFSPLRSVPLTGTIKFYMFRVTKLFPVPIPVLIRQNNLHMLGKNTELLIRDCFLLSVCLNQINRALMNNYTMETIYGIH